MGKIGIYMLVMAFIASCNDSGNLKKAGTKGQMRIVSLTPSMTKELECLGMGCCIVGATSYCDISSKNKELIVGTATEVNIEKILLLKPDIIFASGLAKQTTLEAIRKNGLMVHYVEKIHSFEEICNQFIELGKLTGKGELALSIVNKSKGTIDSLKNTIPRKGAKLKVFFQIGAKPLFTVIPNTFMNDYITFSGCRNIAEDMDKGTITRESVLQRNPDVIFIVTMGIVGEEEKNIWKSYAELNAAKNKKIFIINSNKACTPTVLSFTETLEQVIKNIY